MRQLLKFAICHLFWVGLFLLCCQIANNTILKYEPEKVTIWEWSFFAFCLILTVLSLSWKYAITSPKLGRKIIHESGTYYADFKIEKGTSDFRTSLTVYKDMIFYKKVIHQCYLSDIDEGHIINELRKCLAFIQKEQSYKSKIKNKKKDILNLKSLQNQRADKMKSLF